MATRYTVVKSVYSNLPPTYGIIATDRGFEYVWAKDVEDDGDLDFESRMELRYPEGVPTDLTIDDYQELALYNVGGSYAEEWIDAQNASGAKRELKKILNDQRYLDIRKQLLEGIAQAQEDQSDVIMKRVNDTADELRFHHPDFDDEGSLSADEMALFALGAVGGANPDDPNDPNGWLIRKIMGRDPLPGDENGTLDFDYNGADDE